MKISELELKLKKSELDRDEFKAKADDLQAHLDNARKEIETLNKIRAELKDRTQLENKIAHLQALNSELERQLRFKTLGF